MNGAAAVTVVREVAASIETVFEAFTEPAELVKWWGPAGITTSEVEFDARVGGRCRWVMHPDGNTAVLHGEITAIEAPTLLSMTNRWDGNPHVTHVTFTFVPVGASRTRIEILHERLPSEPGPDEFATAWSAALDSLEEHITEKEQTHGNR